MDFREITLAYYAQWLGVGSEALTATGVRAVYSTERNVQQSGYDKVFDLYAFCRPEGIILSYGDRLCHGIETLAQALRPGMATVDVLAAIEAHTGQAPSHGYKFVYQGAGADGTGAVALGPDDYPAYLQFFKSAHPNVKDTGWLQEYFVEMASRGDCFGVYVDGHLASVTDAPDMPYLAGRVQEIGIHTLPEYRGHGYAKLACAAAARAMVKRGVCPQWSCLAQNAASAKLAESVGFAKLADVFYVSLQ